MIERSKVVKTMGNKGSELQSSHFWNMKGPNYFKYEIRASQQNHLGYRQIDRVHGFFHTPLSYSWPLVPVSVEAFNLFLKSVDQLYLKPTRTITETLLIPFSGLSSQKSVSYWIWTNEGNTCSTLLEDIVLPDENRGYQGIQKKSKQTPTGTASQEAVPHFVPDTITVREICSPSPPPD